jgi:hypothetical protein
MAYGTKMKKTKKTVMYKSGGKVGSCGSKMKYKKGGKVFKPCPTCPTPGACKKAGKCKKKSK